MDTRLLGISCWGFTSVACSALFFYLGKQVDGLFNSEPNFMLGFMLLSVFLCTTKLYKEATRSK